MSDTLRALGESVPVTVEHAGQTLTLSLFTIKDFGEYQLFLEENLIRSVQRAGVLKWLQPHELNTFMDRALALIGAFKLSYGSDAFRESTATLPGLQKLLYLSLRHKHPEVTEELAFQIMRVNPQDTYDKIQKVMVDSV